jgi:hypothetical protein
MVRELYRKARRSNDCPRFCRGIFVWNKRSSLLDPDLVNKNVSERSERHSFDLSPPFQGSPQAIPLSPQVFLLHPQRKLRVFCAQQMGRACSGERKG